MHPYLQGLLGGALIGTAASLLWLLVGRVGGVSGILGGLASATRGDRAWRLAFVVGLLGGGGLGRVISPAWVAAGVTRPLWLLVPAGLLVGVGTRLGGGCTSGHGVCGTARLSRRSLVATCVFMAVAMVTTTLVRSFIGGLS